MIHQGPKRQLQLRLVLSLAICVLVGSCGSGDANHKAVGSWQNDSNVVRIYSDHTASIAGAAARWVKIDANTVRLEANIRSVDYSWEFRVSGSAIAAPAPQQPSSSESPSSRDAGASGVEAGARQVRDEPNAEYRVDPVTGNKWEKAPKELLERARQGRFMTGGPAKSEITKRIETAQASDGELGHLHMGSGQPELFVRASRTE